MKLLSAFFALLLCGIASAQTVGQYELRKRTSTGFTSYGVTLTNGQVIGQTAGVPAAITPLTSSDLFPYLTLATASATFSPIASPTFTGTVTIPSGANISGYLTTATAATTYQPLDADLTTLAGGFGGFFSGVIYWDHATQTYNRRTGIPTSDITFANNGRLLTSPPGVGSGAGTETSVTGVLDWLGSTQGQILYRNGSAWVPLSPGTSGQVLTTGGAAANPSWATPSSSGITIGTTTSNGTAGRVLYTDGANVQSYTISGTGNVAMTTSPTFTTPALGTPSALVLTNATGLPAAGVIGTAAVLGANTFTGNQINSTAGAASAPPLYLTGALLTSGSGTTTFPHIFHQPSGATAATTWSSGANGGTVFGCNEAFGFTGNFVDVRIAGAEKFTIYSTGSFLSGGSYWQFTASQYFRNVSGNVNYNGGYLSSVTGLGITSGPGSVPDVLMVRDADSILQMGADTSTNSATATAQSIKGPDATGTTSTGGKLTIAGGKGTSAGGAVEIATSATNGAPVAYITVSSSGGITLGSGGAAISKILTATATLDFADTAAGTVTDLTITVTGAASGDAVAIACSPGSVPAAGSFSAWVSAADTVTIRFANNALVTSYNPASGTFRATIIKH